MRSSVSGAFAVLCMVVSTTLAVTTLASPIRAQTFQVIYTLSQEWFSSQLTMDAAGTLYGVTANSGESKDSEICEDGCGAVFELYRKKS